MFFTCLYYTIIMDQGLWTTHKYKECLSDMGRILSQLVPTVQRYEKQLLRTLGFTAPQGALLLEVQSAQGLSMGDTARRLGVEISTLTRVAALMIRDGYLERSQHKEDRRRIELNLTEKGQESCLTLRSAVESYYRKLIQGLPAGHVREVMSAVELLSKVMKEALGPV